MKRTLFVILAIIVAQLALCSAQQSCYTTHTIIGPLPKVFDVIVLGGGIAGSVNAHYSVLAGQKTLLVERGIHYNDNQDVVLPGNLYNLLQTPNQAVVNVQSTEQTLMGKLNFVSPSVLGGLNGMIWIRGDVEKYFNEEMPSNWNWTVMKDYFKKIETRPGGNPLVRGLNGPVNVATNPVDAQYNQWKAAYNTVYPNMPERVPDMNSFSPNAFGFGPSETTVHNGERVNGYTSYIKSIENNSKLTIALRTEARKIIFIGGIAVGVLLWRNTTQDYCVAYGTKFVVSAGALNTPKLLKLSGLGPKAELTANGIKVVSNLPHVGANLDDHTTLTETYATSIVGETTSANVYMSHYWNAQDNPSAPLDFSNQWTGFPFALPNIGGLIVALSQKTNQVAKGTVTLNPSNLNGNPIVDFGYFTDVNNTDLHTLALGFQKAEAIAAQFGLYPLGRPAPNFQFPACLNASYSLNCSNPIDNAKAAILSGSGTVGYHFTSTARFGSSYKYGVVNPKNMIVHGTLNVAVIDASVLPVSPRGNTQATVYAVATRGIELFLKTFDIDVPV